MSNRKVEVTHAAPGALQILFLQVLGLNDRCDSSAGTVEKIEGNIDAGVGLFGFAGLSYVDHLAVF